MSWAYYIHSWVVAEGFPLCWRWRMCEGGGEMGRPLQPALPLCGEDMTCCGRVSLVGFGMRERGGQKSVGR